MSLRKSSISHNIRFITGFRRPGFWFAVITTILVGLYFWFLGGQTWDYTRAYLRQLIVYGLGLYIAHRYWPRRAHRGYRLPRFLYDALQMLLLQAIYRNYLVYLAPDERDAVLMPALSSIPVFLSFFYGLFRHRFPRRLIPLVLSLLFLTPPLSLSVVGEVGLAVSTLLATNTVMHFSRAFQNRGPRALQIGVGLILAGALVAPFVTVDLASTLYYWHQTGAFLLILFYTLQKVRNARDVVRIVGPLIACGMVFAVWLATQDYSPELKDRAGVNLNTIAILFEMLFFLSIFVALHVKKAGSRVLFGAAAGLYLCIQLLVYSRSGYAALAGASMLSLAAIVMQRRGWDPRLRALLLGMGFVTGIVLSYTILTIFFAEDPTVQIRRVYWTMALEGFRSHPLYMLFGTGDTGPTYMLFRFPAENISQVMANFIASPWHLEQHPHSDYVAMLYGYGLVGTAGLVLLAFYTQRILTRGSATWGAGILFAAIMTQWIHGIGDCAIVHYFNAAPFWFCLAAFTNLYRDRSGDNRSGAASPASKSSGPRIPSGRAAQIAAFAIVVTVAAGFVVYTGFVIRANALVVSRVPDIAHARLDRALPPEALADLKASAARFDRLNRTLPFLDRNLNLEAEIRYVIARNDQLNAGTDAPDVERVTNLLCQAIQWNASPLYYSRIARIYAALPVAYRPDELCGMAAADFLVEATSRDPYGIGQAKPWILPL